MMRSAPLLLALALLACDRQGPGATPEPLEAPSGQGAYVGGDQQRRTLFEMLGMMHYGDTVDAALPPMQVLSGWGFVGAAGDRPTLALTAPTAGPVLLALYGPRDAQGLWGEPRLVRSGDAAVTIDDFDLPATGEWFVLVRGRHNAAYTLSLSCATCDAPLCDLAPCDLVCEAGYAAQADGCRACACEASAACDPECGEAERCVSGQCVARTCAEDCPATVAPVCGADGRTYRNACAAQCVEVEVVSRGACPDVCRPDQPDDCPEGRACVDGRCALDDCGCAPNGPPVCTASGRTERNRCLAECRGEQVRYEGDCVALACDTPDACPDGFACVPSPRPGNMAACAADPSGAGCIRECMPRRCTEDAQCADEQRCLRINSGSFGLCSDRCSPDRDACPATLICAEGVDGAEPGEGLCVAACQIGPEARCMQGFACQPIEADRGACVPCEHGDPECGGGQGAECGRCGADGPTVCGDDGQLYLNACDAQCHGAQAARPEVCGLGPLDDACDRDEDCRATACGGQICAAAPVEGCADLSEAATCAARLGRCGCARGRCQFTPTRESSACLQHAQGHQSGQP